MTPTQAQIEAALEAFCADAVFPLNNQRKEWVRLRLAAAITAAAEIEEVVKREPTEAQVMAGARIIANSPGIDAPKLPAECWCGLSRAVITAAAEVGPSGYEGTHLGESDPAVRLDSTGGSSCAAAAEVGNKHHSECGLIDVAINVEAETIERCAKVARMAALEAFNDERGYYALMIEARILGLKETPAIDQNLIYPKQGS